MTPSDGQSPNSPDPDEPRDESSDPTGGMSLEDLSRMFSSGDAEGFDIAAVLGNLLGADADPRLREAMAGAGIDLSDPAAMGALQSQVRAMFAPQDDQSISAAATDIARRTVASTGADPTVGPNATRAVEDAVRIANLWIDPVTAFSAPTGTGRAWSRAEWVEATMPTWRTLVEPVADGVTGAMVDALTDQAGRLGDLPSDALEGFDGLPPELRSALPEGFSPQDLSGMMSQMRPMMSRLARTFFTAQTGHAVGTLSADLLSGTEVGLPLLDSEDVVLLPTAVDEFAAGLNLDPAQVRLYLAVREAVRVRLFTEVPWLGPQLEAAVRDYARAITIDTEAIESRIRERMGEIDPSDVQAMQAAMADMQLFKPEPSLQQTAALGRLETSLALVEGWVDLVTDQATAAHLPDAAVLGEAMRRRRAAGGPAEKAFSGLVGLELRPRRLKDARNLWAALESSGGIGFRDAPWAHPDIAPTSTDLDDPLGYVEKRRGGSVSDSMDDEIAKLLDGD